ncbi:MAG: M28 family metallopeptidase [Actinomycetota bacterium]
MIRKRRVLGALAGALMLALVVAQPPGVAKRGPVRYPNLDRVPRPNVTGPQIIKGLEDFVERFPLRQNMLPNNIAAAQFLSKEAKRSGFKSRILELQAGTPERTVRVVEAVKRGTEKPDEWIAFVAHYDVVAGGGVTVQGAYDDGSGTNMLRYFGKALSKIKTKKSIALLWFDAEENGLLASEVYAKKLRKRGQKISAVMGFDMVGIGHPAPYCICVYHGPTAPDHTIGLPIIEHVHFDYLGFPRGDGGTATQRWPVGGEGHVCSCGVNIRNSDESNFADVGYMTLRWTGMRTAADYPGYHQPWDTIPFMEQVAEGRENLEKGTFNTFLGAWYTTFVLDNL